MFEHPHGVLTLRLDHGGPGGRLRALVETPEVTTIIGTPDTVDIETMGQFVVRLATGLLVMGCGAP